jgi:hypothetical protein
MHLAQEKQQLRGFCEHGNEPSGSIKGGEAKGKFAPVLLLTEHHAMKAYWGR